jgi:tRNA-splicing ligase RtcB
MAEIKLWTDGVEVEDEAMAQIRNVASLPIVGPHVAIMPDVHWGIGATVGSVIPTLGAIIPAAVGVDIGCGMMAVRTNVAANALHLARLRAEIEDAIPVGGPARCPPGFEATGSTISRSDGRTS